MFLKKDKKTNFLDKKIFYRFIGIDSQKGLEILQNVF